MFERYTEQARRAIFFARVEAVVRETTIISPIHLLLGLTRDSASRACRLQALEARVPQLHELIGTPVSKSVRADWKSERQIVLHTDVKKALAYAAREAGEGWIDTDTLLLGVLSFPNDASRALQDLGIDLERARLDASELEKMLPRQRVPFLTALFGSWREIRQAFLTTAALITGLLMLVVLIKWINR